MPAHGIGHALGMECRRSDWRRSRACRVRSRALTAVLGDGDPRVVGGVVFLVPMVGFLLAAGGPAHGAAVVAPGGQSVLRRSRCLRRRSTRMRSRNRVRPIGLVPASECCCAVRDPGGELGRAGRRSVTGQQVRVRVRCRRERGGGSRLGLPVRGQAQRQARPTRGRRARAYPSETANPAVCLCQREPDPDHVLEHLVLASGPASSARRVMLERPTDVRPGQRRRAAARAPVTPGSVRHDARRTPRRRSAGSRCARDRRQLRGLDLRHGEDHRRPECGDRVAAGGRAARRRNHR